MITPNLPEAGVLLSASPVETLKEMRRTAEKLRRLLNDSGERWVFLKGGHLPGNDTIDVLHDGDRLIELPGQRIDTRSEEHTSELQSLMRISYAVFCLKQKKKKIQR